MKNKAQLIAEMSVDRTTLSISKHSAYNFNVYKIMNGFKNSDELLMYLLSLAKEKDDENGNVE